MITHSLSITHLYIPLISPLSLSQHNFSQSSTNRDANQEDRQQQQPTSPPQQMTDDNINPNRERRLSAVLPILERERSSFRPLKQQTSRAAGNNAPPRTSLSMISPMSARSRAGGRAPSSKGTGSRSPEGETAALEKRRKQYKEQQQLLLKETEKRKIDINSVDPDDVGRFVDNTQKTTMCGVRFCVKGRER